MNKIEVAILNEAHNNPAGMQLFLAKLTQRGATIESMADLMDLYEGCTEHRRASKDIQALAAMPHGTIKRFAPITIAIVGASRRFLAQARTNQVGLDYVSASLQYSDYSGIGQFVVPYELMDLDELLQSNEASGRYLASCEASMQEYKTMVDYGISNDTAGYAAPQGLRNILIMQGNHQSWDYFIRLRTCNRNTNETKYVATKIWEVLRSTKDGEDLFAFAGPDCAFGKCREGKMSCGHPFTCSDPTKILKTGWPLLERQD